MKQDIRDLFKNREEEISIKLPNNHRGEFLEKLKSVKSPKSNNHIWIKIAAILVIALAISFSVIKSESKGDIAPLIVQIEAVEAEYLKEIETEWESFVAITEDEVLVARFKKKLDILSEDYKDISAQFKKDSNNLIVIESLIENLQTRLNLLKEIQAHLKILDQNKERYENTI